MIWKTNLEAQQTEFVHALDGPKTQPISTVKSNSNKLRNAANRPDPKSKTPLRDTGKEQSSEVELVGEEEV